MITVTNAAAQGQQMSSRKSVRFTVKRSQLKESFTEFAAKECYHRLFRLSLKPQEEEGAFRRSFQFIFDF